MLSKPHTGQEQDLLVDGTLEILKREGVDEGVVRRRRVLFWASLEGQTNSQTSINGIMRHRTS
jgi:hypothetical protein